MEPPWPVTLKKQEFSHACHQREINSRYARVYKLQIYQNTHVVNIDTWKSTMETSHDIILTANFFHRQWGRNESSKTAGLGTIVRQPEGETRLHHIPANVSWSSALQGSRIAGGGRVGAIQTREHSHPPTLKPQVRRT